MSLMSNNSLIWSHNLCACLDKHMYLCMCFLGNILLKVVTTPHKGSFQTTSQWEFRLGASCFLPYSCLVTCYFPLETVPLQKGSIATRSVLEHGHYILNSVIDNPEYSRPHPPPDWPVVVVIWEGQAEETCVATPDRFTHGVMWEERV